MAQLEQELKRLQRRKPFNTESQALPSPSPSGSKEQPLFTLRQVQFGRDSSLMLGVFHTSPTQQGVFLESLPIVKWLFVPSLEELLIYTL